MRVEIPTIMGSEEETGLMVGPVGGEMSEPYEMARELRRWIPGDLVGACDASSGVRIFTKNGFKVYNDSAHDDTESANIERATPECTQPKQLAAYIHASEQIAVGMISNYLTEVSQDLGVPYRARLQRRVVDGNGSRKASQDNYSLPLDADPADFDHALLLAHLATRSIITGAGYVRADGSFRLSQKNGGLIQAKGYGFKGSMYRVDNTLPGYPDQYKEAEARVEVRSGDINLKDWAMQARIGMTALVLAMTPLGESASLVKRIPRDVVDIVMLAKSSSRLCINGDGSLQKTQGESLHAAIDLQQRLAEFAMDSLPLHVDLPSEYFVIAKEQYEYVDLLRRCIREGDQVHALSNKSDWASKLAYITSKYEKDSKRGIKRDLLDIHARKQDMYYDYMEFASDDHGEVEVKRGAGYLMRDRDQTRLSVSAADKRRARHLPPKETRARLRSELLEKFVVRSCDWRHASVETPQGKLVAIELAPNQTEFTELQKDLLQIKY